MVDSGSGDKTVNREHGLLTLPFSDRYVRES